MPRFTVVFHKTDPPHYDLFFENRDSGMLDTFSIHIHNLEHLLGGKPVSITEKPPHRRNYLDFQGPVSNNRGTVYQIDTGRYTLSGRKRELQGLRFSGTLEIFITDDGIRKARYYTTKE